MTRPPAPGGAKPTPADLGIDPAELDWKRSGDGDGSIEVAFPADPRWARGDWVLVRVAGDPAGRVLVFDRNEWECFLDGARNGEFDAAAAAEPVTAEPAAAEPAAAEPREPTD